MLKILSHYQIVKEIFSIATSENSTRILNTVKFEHCKVITDPTLQANFS